MENDLYNQLIENDLNKLLTISDITDLTKYKYKNRFLIEYLLEKNIHSLAMDKYLSFNPEWIYFYVKYNIIKPLLNIHLMPLLYKYQNHLLLDLVLDILDDNDKITLYNNFKINSYWDYHNYEDEVIKSYLKKGIKLPKIFVNSQFVKNSASISRKDEELIEEFKDTFCDQSDIVINAFVVEIKNRLKVNQKRVFLDIKKLINYKRKNPLFKIELLNNAEGEYDASKLKIAIDPHRVFTLSHELSHLFYDKMDSKRDILSEYEDIRLLIDNDEVKDKIIKYLKVFHQRYHEMENIFQELYYLNIRKKYHSYNNYIKKICDDMIKNKPDIITTNDVNNTIFFVEEDSILDIVSELLTIEKNEYIRNHVRNFYSEELMLENLLDALLYGKIFDEFVNIDCLSGHSNIDFLKNDSLSFDECLANYDAINNSRKGIKLLSDLESLVGKEIIEFLDRYLVMNRDDIYGR